MSGRTLLAISCGIIFLVLALVARRSPDSAPTPAPAWRALGQIGEAQVYRTTAEPSAYLIAVRGHGLLIDAPEGIPEPPNKVVIEQVLLTHHHRDTVAGAREWLSRGVVVRAPVASAEWLERTKVAKFWEESIPPAEFAHGVLRRRRGVHGDAV